MLDEQPVETTVYSLGEFRARRPTTSQRRTPLEPSARRSADHRRSPRAVPDPQISAGGMLIRAYCDIEPGTRLSIELKQGEPISGIARWTKGECVGVSFDPPIDVLALLASSERRAAAAHAADRGRLHGLGP